MGDEPRWNRLHLGIAEPVDAAVRPGHEIAAVIGGKGDPDDVRYVGPFPGSDP